MYKKLVKIDVSQVYTCRVAILVEDSPQSNTYNQIILTQEQFMKVSILLYELNGGEDFGTKPVLYKFKELGVKLSDAIRSHYKE